MRRPHGFTLIEISIVLVIVRLLLGAVLYGVQVTIGNTKATSTITLIKDLSGAVTDFKARYHYLPGDLPHAAQDIAGITANSPCDIAAGAGNIGNGLIDTSQETICASQELVLAGIIKGDTAGIVSAYSVQPDVTLMASNKSAINTTTPFPLTVQNVIQISGIPFDAAQTIDSKLDDGDLATGNVRAYPLPIGGTPPATTTLDIAL